MSDAGPPKLESLSAHIHGLQVAVLGLPDDPSAAISVRRIARSLESAAQEIGAGEIAAGAQAIQRATDAQLARSAGNFLERFEELSSAEPSEVHILLVEDNKTAAAATTAYLNGGGRTVHLARTAFDAETVLAERPIDVVVLDLILPDRDGRDLLVQMRESPTTAHLPVIVLSARGGAAARAECLAVGADAFLEKPTEPRELRAVVARVLSGAGRERDAAVDPSTRLPNRVGVAKAFERLCADGEPVGVAVLRIDGLAALEQAAGRDAAEAFLRELSNAVRAALRAEDVLGRWETGELVALFPGVGADAAQELLSEALRAARGLATAEGGATVAVGGGVAVPDAHDVRDAILEAQRAYYDAARTSEATEQPDVAESPEADSSEPAEPTESMPAGAVPRDRSVLSIPVQRILLVEDDRVTGTLIHHRLVRDGHQVVDFANGEDAFTWATHESFDLAILDVKVPGMDGFELLERLRALPRYADVPIVMLTGMGSEADVVRGLDLGADDYMLKPFSPTELLARVRRLLHARRSGEGDSLTRSVGSR